MFFALNHSIELHLLLILTFCIVLCYLQNICLQKFSMVHKVFMRAAFGVKVLMVLVETHRYGVNDMLD